MGYRAVACFLTASLGLNAPTQALAFSCQPTVHSTFFDAQALAVRASLFPFSELNKTSFVTGASERAAEILETIKAGLNPTESNVWTAMIPTRFWPKAVPTPRILQSVGPKPPAVNPQGRIDYGRMTGEERFWAGGLTLLQLEDFIKLFLRAFSGAELTVEAKTLESETVRFHERFGYSWTAGVLKRLDAWAQDTLKKMGKPGDPFFIVNSFPKSTSNEERRKPAHLVFRLMPHDHGSPEAFYRDHPPLTSLSEIG